MARNCENSVGLEGYVQDIMSDYATVRVPLVGWSIEVEAFDFMAEITVTHCFENSSSNQIEAVYSFPIDEQSSICAFKAEFGSGVVINGKVMEKDEAAAKYHNALQNNKKTSLLTEIRPDIFTIAIGSLKPCEIVKISITYVTMMKAENDSCTLVLPSGIAPRYQAISSTSALQCHPANTIIGQSLSASFQMHSAVVGMQCPSHQNEPSLNISTRGNKATLRLTAFETGRDIILKCVEESAHQTRAYLEVAPNNSVVGLVTLFPRLEMKNVDSEYTFMVDRSGSMSGPKIEQAREAISIFLRALPCSCSFNIYGFGSRFTSLFENTVIYNDESLTAATAHVQSMQADMGGTEIRACLQQIFQQSKGRSRRIFLLTDGEVSNEKEIFALVEEEVQTNINTKLFCVGIGENVSHHLVQGIARAGNGTSKFVRSGEDMTVQPALDNVNVIWNFPGDGKEPAPIIESKCSEEKPKENLAQDVHCQEIGTNQNALHPQIEIIPSRPASVFNFERFTSFARFSHTSGRLPESVTISASCSDELLTVNVPIKSEDLFYGCYAHRLAARGSIREYEESRRSKLKKEEVVELAIQNNLMSSLTSFVAVDESTNQCLCHHVAPRPVWRQYEYAANSNLVLTSERKCRSETVREGYCPPGAKFKSDPSSVTATVTSALQQQQNSASSAGRTNELSDPEIKGSKRQTCREDDSEDRESKMPCVSMDVPALEIQSKGLQDKMVALCVLQHADGHFSDGESIIKLFALPCLNMQGVIQVCMAEHEHQDHHALASTVLAIVAFRKWFATNREVWELIEHKAIEWLAKNGLPRDEMDKTIGMVGALLENKYVRADP